MLDALKDHFITFASGFTFPAASISDAFTSDRYQLSAKLAKIANAHSSSESADNCTTYGLIVGGISMAVGAIALSAAAVSAAAPHVHAVNDDGNAVTQQSRDDAQTGARKVLEAASAARLELH